MIRLAFKTLFLLLLLSSCKTSDFLTRSRIQSGKTDFFYSRDQFEKQGISGYCLVWDRARMDYRIFPYTYKVTKKLTSEYYMYFDWVYVGRGNEIIDPHNSKLPENRDIFKKVKIISND